MKKPSIWYWVICVLGLLWSCGGAFDYVMTRTQNADYMAQFPPELLDYYYNMPLLLDFTWPLAVWCGFIGWALMLLRRQWSVPLFLVSFVAMLINFGYMFFDGGLALQAQHLGATSYAMTAMVILLGVFALWFSRRSRAKGILK
jgi:cell division protein FtsX